MSDYPNRCESCGSPCVSRFCPACRIGIAPPNADLAPELRARLAEYHVLAAYDLERSSRYGDMAGGRRGREINRLGNELIDAGVRVDRTGHFPESTPAELGAAFERVARPRIRRVERETFRRDTPYTRATVAAWRVTESLLLLDGGLR